MEKETLDSINSQNITNSENTEQVATTENDSGKKGTNALKEFGDILETVVITCFFVLIIFTFILRPVTVSGQSMQETFHNEDRVFMISISYTPKCGDVVIVDQGDACLLDENGEIYTSPGLNERIIKRVIAVGGQTLDIDFETGTVTVDGNVLDETYISTPTIKDEGGFTYPLTIPDGYIFVMGDNREHSTDSRSDSVGLIPEDDVIGHVVCKYYPLSDFELID